MLTDFETTAEATTVIEASYAQGRQDYTFTVIAVTGPDTVRVRVKVDSYAAQSYACAEVLAADRTWTGLLDEPASEWHPRAPSYASHHTEAKRATVEELADRLLYRATRVLAATHAAEATR